MLIKKILKKNKKFMTWYRNHKENKKTKTKYKFIDRRTSNNSLCYILAGYKPYLWGEVFARIKKYVSNNIDVCILSSGGGLRRT